MSGLRSRQRSQRMAPDAQQWTQRLADLAETLRVDIKKGLSSDERRKRLENEGLRASRKILVGEGLVKVKIDGELQQVPASDLVVGDVLFVDAGDAVPADARIIFGHNLQVDMSELTGELDAVKRRPDDLCSATEILDAENMLLANTTVLEGSAEAVVTSIGRNTANAIDSSGLLTSSSRSCCILL
eukprot:TRINITY_DN2698_c0_g2_i1.p1 TRINITY_DN2698_c0_g2~~TRINITY_DN2698_c0_g2_i1.p1  ORF type:complete len:186 (+),score=28.62 TRINITY_DN2698_c0_g2_i1:105-662(+)